MAVLLLGLQGSPIPGMDTVTRWRPWERGEMGHPLCSGPRLWHSLTDIEWPCGHCGRCGDGPPTGCVGPEPAAAARREVPWEGGEDGAIGPGRDQGQGGWEAHVLSGDSPSILPPSVTPPSPLWGGHPVL